MNLTGTGIWSSALRYSDPGETAEGAAELESLGYSAVWIPDVGGDLFGPLENLLEATSKITVATGILNVWRHTPAETTEWWGGLSVPHQARLLLGLGISHAPLIGETWERPLANMIAYLDELDAASTPLPRSARCLAALGPKMLELSRDRTAGAHPYLVTPEHTADARQLLGPTALLAPEQGVVLESDPERARSIARQALTHYTALPNYVRNWKRLGYTDDDVAQVSDRLVDGLVAWGDVDAIAARVAAHRAAGADHICVQVLTESASDLPLAAMRQLAPALTAPG
jgi:probable F420-dependent oxidoreductase